MPSTLGIIDVPGDVPGTVYIHHQEQRLADLDRDQTLHRAKDGTILFPQPDDNPNDPLTWPLWQRDMMLAVLLFVAVIATTATPILAANTITVALYFRKSFLFGARLTAYHLAGAAVSAWISVPFARVFGKRSIFLFAALLMVASSAWAGSTHHSRKDFASLIWARVFQGVAVAPFESLVNTCVGDLYYVHERGPRMAIVNTILFAAAFVTPVFVGMMTDNPHFGWQWTFYFIAIFEAVGFLLLFFLVPETAYRRPLYLETDFNDKHIPQEMGDFSGSSEGRDSDEKQVRTQTAAQHEPKARRSYLQRLSPFDGRKTDDSFFMLLLRPFPLFFHPAIIYGCLLQGVIIGWTVMIGVITSLVYIGPPLLRSEAFAGYQYTSAVIGAVLGLLFSGLFSEMITRYLTRLNNGKYEPEFRLVLVVPTLISSAIGLYGFGISAASLLHYGYITVDVFFGFVVFSMVTGTVAAAQYILDAHRDISIEAFTNMIIFKNIFSFILAYYSYNWVIKGGIKTMFMAFGSIQVVICLLAIPMYIFGKRNRAFFHKHDLLKMTKLR